MYRQSHRIIPTQALSSDEVIHGIPFALWGSSRIDYDSSKRDVLERTGDVWNGKRYHWMLEENSKLMPLY